MKKTILLLVAVAFGFTSFAQKPSEGNILTEANFSLNEWNNEFSLPSLRVMDRDQFLGGMISPRE